MRIGQVLQWGFLALGFMSASAVAGISLDSSRIVFPYADISTGQSVGVSSSAQSATPYLVKAQVLGDVKGQQTETPFSVTPALFRLEPGTTNQLRILKTGNQTLGNNKESIFYLRVMALPAGNGKESEAKTELGGAITVSTGSIIKLFYRPADLPMTQRQAMASLQFSRQGTSLTVTNPSPYYVTLTSLTVGGKAVSLSARQQNTMLAPFGRMTYTAPNAVGKVTWQAINDFGGTEKFNATLP
ncbi:molecular chaperone (plasmid) [Providencia rettgeri]|uniref:fimbrial biogenesis chaperone n=1 Tax=Providencia rettgeri TaxID=587 RepID=UPI001CA79CDF|nr:molecular chaperone [Providencia rettgeri]QZY66578.1 molecular chaperone [Providencia rettgeri]